MDKKQIYFKYFRKALSLFIFSVFYLATSPVAFAQNADLDLESELATEPAAEPATDTVMEPTITTDRQDTVVVERMKDPTLPYKERRSTWGTLFSVNYEQFYPENYNSLVLNQDYITITGDQSIPMVGAEFGVKYNFSLGSASALVGYSQGSIDNTATNLDEISATITKVVLNISLDNIFDEPYVAPYVQIGVHSIDWLEKSTVAGVTNEESFSTDWNIHYKAGVSFQLNWIERTIDPSSQDESLRSGLENTYIDIFYTSYAQPPQVASVNGAEGEADLQSSQIGAGLKLEF